MLSIDKNKNMSVKFLDCPMLVIERVKQAMLTTIELDTEIHKEHI